MADQMMLVGDLSVGMKHSRIRGKYKTKINEVKVNCQTLVGYRWATKRATKALKMGILNQRL